jgi:ADP-ribosylglycohydrolase
MADAALTHADPRAGTAAFALALWVREHLRGENDPAAALERVRSILADRPALPDVLPAPAAIDGLAVRSTAFSLDVLHGVAHHVLGTRSARKAVGGAANEAGAGSCVLGAATGAVAGACRGAAALPDAWTTLLRGAAAWTRLAERLLPATAG